MNLESIKFKVRFLKFYILFGLFGLAVEFIVRYFILFIISNDFFATVIGIISGVLFAYWSNIQFNFQIPNYRLRKALILFILIGVLSKLLQILLGNSIGVNNFGYEIQRLITSSIMFLLFYFLNVQFTFSNRTQIGIAIYANQIENVVNIYSKVFNSPDFIQIDFVDNTVYPKAYPLDISKIKLVKEIWPEKFIELHLMSKNLAFWESELINQLQYLDMIIFDKDSFSNDLEIIQKLKTNKPSLGIGVYLQNSTNIIEINKFTKICDQITIMGIKKLGYSGQPFLENTLTLVENIDKFENRNKFKLEIDGGIDSTNFYKLKVDKIVSASSVLNSENSFKKVLEFKKL